MPIGKDQVGITIKADDKASRVLTGINGKIQGMSKQLKMAGVGMMAAGAAITGALVMSVKAFAEAGDEVQKMALRTGFATEVLSELRHAAELSGASLADIEKGTKKMAKTITDAGDGLETYVRSFRKIGLNVEDLQAMKPEEQFWAITEAIADLEDHTLKVAVSQEIFGRAGTNLLPMLAQGSDGIKKMREEAHTLGIVFDQEAADKAADFNDAMTRMNTSVTGLKMSIAENLIPTLMPLIENIKEVVSSVIAWMQEHPALTKTLVRVAAAIGALLIPLGMFLILLPMLSAGVATLTAVSSPWLLIIGAIILAVVALVAIGIVLYKNWDKIKEKAVAIWNTIASFFVKVWDTITGIFSEHWDKILAILFPAIGIPILIARHWDEIMGFFKGLWDVVAGVFQTAWKKIYDTVIAPIISVVATIKKVWDTLIGFFQGLLVSVRGIFNNIARAMYEPIKLAIDWIIGMVNRMIRAINAATALLGISIPEIPFTMPELPTFKQGGVMKETGLAYLHRGETVLPARTMITIPIYLDGELITERVVERVGEEAILQGY